MKDKIKEFLVERGHQVKLSDSRIITNHQFADFEIRIAGNLSSCFPFSLPKLFLLDRNKYGSLAHVGWNTNNEGEICNGVTENIHIDYNQPEEVYLLALNKAVETINSLLSDKKKNEEEILEEFSAHWRFATGNKKEHRVINFLEPSENIFEITPIVTHDPLYKNTTIFINTQEGHINSDYYFLNRLQKQSNVQGKGLYLPINKPILPPNPKNTIMDWWLKLLRQLPENTKLELKRISKCRKSKIFWIISSVQISSNTYSWFCIKFENQNKTNSPLIDDMDTTGWSALAYNTILHNKEYVKPRGGAINNLDNKTIAIIGCGSVGAEIAREIASSGIGKLVFVDFDSLDVENIYRHSLSSQYIGSKKTEALAYELKSKYPYLKTESSELDYLKECSKQSSLNSIDGIIVATGNPTEERYFNQELFKNTIRPWVIYAWTEGHGIGGHAVYAHTSGKGCLNCLYRDEYGNKSLNSIQNFLESEQDFATDIAGCGTYFLPYSYTDAIQTAILATRLTLYAFQDQLTESCRISWKGITSPNFNLETTYRYKQFKNSLVVETLFWDGCDVCNIQKT